MEIGLGKRVTRAGKYILTWIMSLPKIKDGVYVKNLEDTQSKEPHWVSLCIDKSIAAYFDPFGIESTRSIRQN